MKDKYKNTNKTVGLKINNNTNKIICIAVQILIILIYVINQALGYGNIAMAQELDSIKTTYLSSCLTGFGTSLEVVALIKLINRPVQSILLTLISQIILIASDISQGYSLYEAFSNTGVLEIYFNLIAIGMLIILWRQYRNQANKSKEQLALSKYINFERPPIKVPIWAIFSIICLCLSLVISSAYKLEVGLWSDTIQFRMYVGLTIFIPTLTTLSMYTASNLVYYLYGSMMALKVVAIYKLIERSEFRWTVLLICMIQMVVYIYCLIQYIAYRKSNNTNIE